MVKGVLDGLEVVDLSVVLSVLAMLAQSSISLMLGPRNDVSANKVEVEVNRALCVSTSQRLRAGLAVGLGLGGLVDNLLLSRGHEVAIKDKLEEYQTPHAR